MFYVYEFFDGQAWRRGLFLEDVRTVLHPRCGMVTPELASALKFLAEGPGPADRVAPMETSPSPL